MNLKNKIWPTKKLLGEVLIGLFFAVASIFLFYKGEYGWGVLLILALIPLNKRDSLTELAVSLTGGFKTKFSSNTESRLITGFEKEGICKSKVALISYKVASQLPGTVCFNFLKDWKVWFWIANHEPKKYQAYVKVKFIANGVEKEVTEGYFGSKRAWKLDVFTGIQAPGLGIPKEIKDAAQKGKRVKIQIDCEVRGEKGNFIEKKFPKTYVYDSQKNTWYLEP